LEGEVAKTTGDLSFRLARVVLLCIGVLLILLGTAVMRLAATGDWAYVGRLYLDPVFRNHCLPYPVAGDTWRSIFVCDWSDQLEKRDEWKELT
jgi:hypothetical protein